MTRNDYIKFAAVFNERKQALQNGSAWTNGGKLMWELLVLDSCAIFMRDNNNFNRSRFLEACGYGDL